jgi:hypothetical protein
MSLPGLWGKLEVAGEIELGFGASGVLAEKPIRFGVSACADAIEREHRQQFTSG